MVAMMKQQSVGLIGMIGFLIAVVIYTNSNLLDRLPTPVTVEDSPLVPDDRASSIPAVVSKPTTATTNAEQEGIGDHSSVTPSLLGHDEASDSKIKDNTHVAAASESSLPPPPKELEFVGLGPTTNVAKELLTELRPIDREYYTIRINTWHRPVNLALSVHHHAQCEGVKEIQVVWMEEGDPPESIVNMDKVVIERHDVNSLNERFNITSDVSTLGILSLDDDILKPCMALDEAFFKWTRHPDRMVGFDFRGVGRKFDRLMVRYRQG